MHIIEAFCLFSSRHLPDPVLENAVKDHPSQKYVAGRSAIFVDLMPSVAYGTRYNSVVTVHVLTSLSGIRLRFI
jgi:hypothetical protein